MANISEAFIRGHQAGQVEQEHQQAMEQNKLHAMILKHQIDALKIDDTMRQQAIAENQLKYATGQPAAESYTKIPNAPAGAMGPGISFGNQPGPETVQTAPEPIQIPGLPGAAPVSVRPQTMEQLVAQRQQAEIEKAMAAQMAKGPQLHNVPAGTSVIDAANPSAGAVYTEPNKPSTAQPTEGAIHREAYAASKGKTWDTLTPQEKLAFPGFKENGSTSKPSLSLPSWALDDSRPSGNEANTVDKATGLTPNGLYQAAMTYIKTLRFPPTGLGNQPEARAKRDAITNKAGAIAASTGMDVPTLQAFFKSNAAALTQQQKLYDAAQSFMKTADRNVDALSKVLPLVGDTGSPLFNQPLRLFEKSVQGKPALSKFATYLTSVQNEYGKILTNPNLSGQLTDSARHEAQQLIDPSATVPMILASISALKNEGENRLISIAEQIQTIQGRMNGDGTTKPPAPTATPTSTIEHWTRDASGKLVKQ